MLVEMAVVTIHVLTEDIVQPENVECTSGQIIIILFFCESVLVLFYLSIFQLKNNYTSILCNSGAELKFAIMGTNWFGKQEAITTLNVAYKTLWSSMLELE